MSRVGREKIAPPKEEIGHGLEVKTFLLKITTFFDENQKIRKRFKAKDLF